MVETGDLIFFRTRFKWYSPISWLSAAIRFFAKIEYNHVGVIVSVWEEPMVLEAVGRGITMTPLSVRLKKNDTIIKRPIKQIIEDEFAVEACDFAGHTRYDIIGLIWHQLVWNVCGIWIGPDNEDKATKSFYCYEYAAYLHRDLFPNWIKVNPKEFLNSDKLYKVDV